MVYLLMCVTRRKQKRPGIASNDHTKHVPIARSSGDLTKPKHTLTRHTRAKDRIILYLLMYGVADDKCTGKCCCLCLSRIAG